MSFEREVLSDRTEARQECLRTFGIAEATHAALAFTRRLMASMSRKLSQHKGLNNRAENSHQPTRVREKVMRRFKSARHLQRFASVHDQVANLFMHCRYHTDAKQKRALRTQAFETWESVTCAPMLERLAA